VVDFVSGKRIGLVGKSEVGDATLNADESIDIASFLFS
jgi:hypothetical protein